MRRNIVIVILFLCGCNNLLYSQNLLQNVNEQQRKAKEIRAEEDYMQKLENGNSLTSTQAANVVKKEVANGLTGLKPSSDEKYPPTTRTELDRLMPALAGYKNTVTNEIVALSPQEIKNNELNIEFALKKKILLELYRKKYKEIKLLNEKKQYSDKEIIQLKEFMRDNIASSSQKLWEYQKVLLNSRDPESKELGELIGSIFDIYKKWAPPSAKIVREEPKSK